MQWEADFVMERFIVEEVDSQEEARVYDPFLQRNCAFFQIQMLDASIERNVSGGAEEGSQ